MANKITAHLKKVLKYFDKDGDTYHIKKGVVCIMEGFVEDYITMISPNEDGMMRGYSMASDNKYELNDDAINILNVYKLNKVT